VARLREALSLRKAATRRTLLAGGAFFVGFLILGVVGIQAWEYSNSVAFCSDTCHAVHPEEPAAFQDSYHARVKCTECHMGRLGTLESIVVKMGHFRHLPDVLTGNYSRPVQSESLRPPNESCERCHWPPAFHGDTVREITHYQEDLENTLQRIYLILKTGGGQRDRGLGYGIHWHIENPVEYIATDERKQEIAWVRTTLPDGRTVEYTDVTNPLPDGEVDQSEIKVMDCVDCHNRVGHPFLPPDPAIDEAMAEGRVSTNLPAIKAELSDLLTADYPDQETALAAVDDFAANYSAEYPDVAQERATDIEQAASVAKELITHVVFARPGVTWESFPDNSQHKQFAGCFRCHDGKHLSPEGESIRLHCNICHSIPVTVGEGDRAPQMPVVSVDEPSSHLDPQFMFEHRFLANESCSTCHGEVAFGSDDSSFCSNSACHGQAWPDVQLDAGFEHPVALVGQHSQAWCHQCHNGETRPEYVCANCHEPPQNHFDASCDQCHTPEGWAESAVGLVSAAPEIPHPVEGREQCLVCHDGASGIVSIPADHTNYDSEQCQFCHKPGAVTTAAAPEIPHPTDELSDCLVCHDSGQGSVPAPANHTDFMPDQCELCHTQTPTLAQTLPEIPHPVEGREACLTCHNPEGGMVAAPASHASFVNDQCKACHEQGDVSTVDAPEIPHPLDGLDSCLVCHDPDEGSVPAPASHAEYTVDQCELCHEQGNTTAFSPPQIPHPLEGRDQCLACHNPSGGIKPAPSSHASFENEFCRSCHEPAP
jgi:hypothetical protein